MNMKYIATTMLTTLTHQGVSSQIFITKVIKKIRKTVMTESTMPMHIFTVTSGVTSGVTTPRNALRSSSLSLTTKTPSEITLNHEAKYY